MRRTYSAQADSAQAGRRLLTARTRSLGTGLLRGLRPAQAHALAAPHLLEVVELAHRRMHDVHHDVAEVDEHPFAVSLALDAEDARAERLELLLHVVGERLDLARRVAARDDD